MKASELADKTYQEYKDDVDYLTAVQMLDISEQICKQMTAKGISQHELAGILGVKQPFISRLLNLNQNTSIKTLIKVAHALDLSVNVLISEREQIRPKVTSIKTEFDDYDIEANTDLTKETSTTEKVVEKQANLEDAA